MYHGLLKKMKCKYTVFLSTNNNNNLSNMVKNTCGGNKHKSQARKTVVGSRQQAALRLAREEGEVYAQVIKIFGGTLFSALCLDGVTRNCVIRGKFRSKRDCIISSGSWILVGLREYLSIKNDTVETCDLLEVYTDSDKEKLKTQHQSLNWKIFNSSNGTRSSTQDATDELINFTDTTDEEYQNIMNQELSNEMTGSSKPMTSIAFDEDEVDIDDI